MGFWNRLFGKPSYEPRQTTEATGLDTIDEGLTNAQVEKNPHPKPMSEIPDTKEAKGFCERFQSLPILPEDKIEEIAKRKTYEYSEGYSECWIGTDCTLNEAVNQILNDEQKWKQESGFMVEIDIEEDYIFWYRTANTSSKGWKKGLIYTRKSDNTFTMLGYESGWN